MANTRPGEAVPTDPRGAWFAWRARHLEASDREIYEWGLKIGRRMAIEETASWAGLVPLLQDVLAYLIDAAVERDMEAVVPLTGVTDQACEQQARAGDNAAAALDVAPDLTVGHRGLQQWAL